MTKLQRFRGITLWRHFRERKFALVASIQKERQSKIKRVNQQSKTCFVLIHCLEPPIFGRASVAFSLVLC